MRVTRAWWPALLALSVATAACGGREGGGDRRAAAADSSAVFAALAIPDPTSREAALDGFLTAHPESKWRARAYYGMLEPRMATDPMGTVGWAETRLAAEAEPAARSLLLTFLYNFAVQNRTGKDKAIREQIQTDKKADGLIFSAVARDLVGRGEDVDLAIKLADTGLERAANKEMRAGLLDTKGYAHYLKKDYDQAIRILSEARSLIARDEKLLDSHLAMTYEAAGKKREARDVLADLLAVEDDPQLKAKVLALTQELGEASEPVLTRVEDRRYAQAPAAPDFALKDYTGNVVHLSDFRGKVVLLNFWHPT